VGAWIRSHMTRGASESSLWVQSHGTCGGAGALPIREAGSGAAGHMTASKPTSTGRPVPVLWDMWWCVVARPALYLDLKLVRGVPDLQGTNSGPRAHLRGGSEFAGGANIFFPRVAFLKFHLGGWSGSVPLPANTRQCLVDAPCRSVCRG
jgi:hypothetical protein